MIQMLSICERYALENQILFNGGKSKAIAFHPKGKTLDNVYSFSLNGIIIPNVNRAEHLGHVLDNTVDGYVDVKPIISAFKRSANCLIADMGLLPANVMSRLFQQYCCSFYGITLCKLQLNELYCLFTVVWRKIV